MTESDGSYDIIVVGGGHAGTEAALASARMGCSTLLLTLNIDTLGFMSCNPSIGGVGKGHIVKEIDSLGGEMAQAIDASGIQFRRLNLSRGHAARALRAQADRSLYRAHITRVLSQQPGLQLRQALAASLTVEQGRITGVLDTTGQQFFSRAVIITPGTFLNGLIHIGMKSFPGGRIGDMASCELSANLRELGFTVGRFKTGTTPRLDGRTIDFSKMELQPGDSPPMPFSFRTEKINTPQRPCHITYTNSLTHEIIRGALDRSPLYSGVIKGTGVRYCPSIEDKVVRFHERERHHVFVEPEGLDSIEYYPNGLSTSLPLDVQIKMLRSIPGFERVEIIRPGYGIEHDYIDSRQLFPTLETKLIENLYCAGQINGTTGYEEAACQGLMAGINAALKIRELEPLILERSQAYIGVLIDDLVTKGTTEPYRMLSSRCEYHLLLREDNADLRLMETGNRIGLIDDLTLERLMLKKAHIEEEVKRLRSTRINPTRELNAIVTGWGTSAMKKTTSLDELLRRPELDYQMLAQLSPLPGTLTDEEITQVELEIKYKGFIDRLTGDLARKRSLEDSRIPPELSYRDLPGLNSEAVEKLEKIRPVTLGQASRISGITPSSIWSLMIYLKKLEHARKKKPAALCQNVRPQYPEQPPRDEKPVPG